MTESGFLVQSSQRRERGWRRRKRRGAIFRLITLEVSGIYEERQDKHMCVIFIFCLQKCSKCTVCRHFFCFVVSLAMAAGWSNGGNVRTQRYTNDCLVFGLLLLENGPFCFNLSSLYLLCSRHILKEENWWARQHVTSSTRFRVSLECFITTVDNVSYSHAQAIILKTSAAD